MIKPVIAFNLTTWNTLVSCICPQILGCAAFRQFRKYSRVHSRTRLVWSCKPKPDMQSRQRYHINPHYKEVV